MVNQCTTSSGHSHSRLIDHKSINQSINRSVNSCTSGLTHNIVDGSLDGGVPVIHERRSLSLKEKLFSKYRRHLGRGEGREERDEMYRKEEGGRG